MADMIKFFKGLEASLPASGVNGALYITTDEGAIYLGTGTGMKRLGDFVQVDNVAALPEKAHESCLYYCVAENILAKWNGTEWKQINKQPTAEELKTLLGLKALAYKSEVAEGDLNADLAAKINASTAVNHSHANKDVLDGITAEKVAAWDSAESNAKSYADGLATGIKNDIIGDIAEGKTVVDIVGEAVYDDTQVKADIKANADAIDAIKDGAAVDSFADVEAELTKKVDKVEGKSLVDDAEITKLAGVSEGANKVEKSDTNGNIKVDGSEVVVYTHPEKHAIADVDGLQGALDGKQAAGNYSEVGHKHVKADITDFAHTHVASEITDLDTTIKGYDYATKTELGNVDKKFENYKTAEAQKAIDDEQNRRLGVIEGDYLKAADKTELEGKITAEENRAKGVEENLQTQINTIMNNPDTEGVINSINEFTQYIADHGEIAEGFRADIDKNKEDIAANTKAISDHEALAAQTYETKENAAAKFDEVKAAVEAIPQADWNQNDETAPDYIKNRPFYVVAQGKTIISEVTFTDADYGTTYDGVPYADVEVLGGDELSADTLAQEDAHFDITLDGITYTNVPFVKVYSNIGYFGSASPVSESSEYPFTLWSTNGDWTMEFLTAGEHTVKAVRSGAGEIIQLDEKFIPDTIARTADVNASVEALDGRVATLEAIDHDYAGADATLKAELQKEIDDDVKAAIDAEVLRADGAYDKKGDAAAAQSAAEAKAAELDAALKTELQGEIDADVKVVSDAFEGYKTSNDAEVAKKANSADVYAKTETYTQAEVDAAIEAAITEAHTWGSF